MIEKNLLLIGTTIALSACTSQPPLRQWFANQRIDKFTDTSSCRVEPLGLGRAQIFSVAPAYFPYIERRGVDVRVGLISAGRVSFPVGRVQLRVDGNEAWTIETSETPVDMSSNSAAQLATAMQAATPNLTPEAKEVLARSAAASTGAMDQVMSPFTAATGDKAKQIIAQMRQGSQLIYRTVGVNQPGSAEGRVPLGTEFIAALAACGL